MKAGADYHKYLSCNSGHLREEGRIISGAKTETANRLTIHRLVTESGSQDFAEDTRKGLSSKEKFLLPKYFYDELGAHLFEAICYLPEYYVTRAEAEILREGADEIIRSVGIASGGKARLIELGSGSSTKTRFFIEALLRRQGELHYLPMDISDASLEASSRVLLQKYAGLTVTAYAADYTTAFRALAAETRSSGSVANIALFLGSSIGNLDYEESVALLANIRGALRAGDALLLGADLKKSADILVPAYDDALGVTAAFNLNLLARINRELGGDFDLKKFRHRAIYDEDEGRMEMHLVSRERQAVQIRAIDLEPSFEEDEYIHTENSYKYDLDHLSKFAKETGFNLAKTWFDSNRWFSFNLFSAV